MILTAVFCVSIAIFMIYVIRGDLMPVMVKLLNSRDSVVFTEVESLSDIVTSGDPYYTTIQDALDQQMIVFLLGLLSNKYTEKQMIEAFVYVKEGNELTSKYAPLPVMEAVDYCSTDEFLDKYSDVIASIFANLMQCAASGAVLAIMGEVGMIDNRTTSAQA